MLLLSVLMVIAILSATSTYILMQDRHAASNRLFTYFALSITAAVCATAVRLTSRNPQEIWFVSGVVAPFLAGGSLFLIWLILALFIPHRYAQPAVRWGLATPYLIATLLLALDWYGGFRIIRFDTVGSDNTITFSNGPAAFPMLMLYITGNTIVPLAFLIAIAIRSPHMRAPALWLIGGVALSNILGFVVGRAIPALTPASLMPLYLAFGWVTLRYQVFRPSNVALHTAIEHLPDGVVVLDEQRRARFANRAAQQLAPHLASGADETPFEEALARAGFVERTTPDDHPGGPRRFRREGEVAATLVASEAVIEGDPGAASVLLLRDMTTIERQQAALAASRATLEERTAELERSLAEIQQRDTLITRLTLPLIPLSDGVLVMPLIGAFDGARCEALLTMLLKRIEERLARVVLLDLTGITGFDSSLAATLRQAADGARLMGAEIVLCGVRPDIAESIVHERMHLNGVRHFATMQEGVAALLRNG